MSKSLKLLYYFVIGTKVKGKIWIMLFGRKKED